MIVAMKGCCSYMKRVDHLTYRDPYRLLHILLREHCTVHLLSKSSDAFIYISMGNAAYILHHVCHGISPAFLFKCLLAELHELCVLLELC